MRILDTISKMCVMARNMVGKRLTYGQPVAPNTLCGGL